MQKLQIGYIYPSRPTSDQVLRGEAQQVKMIRPIAPTEWVTAFSCNPVFCFFCLVCCLSFSLAVDVFDWTQLKASFIFHLTNCMSLLFPVWLCARVQFLCSAIRWRLMPIIICLANLRGGDAGCGLVSLVVWQGLWSIEDCARILCTITVFIGISVKYVRHVNVNTFVQSGCIRMAHHYLCDSLAWISSYNQNHFVYKYPGE